MALRRGLWPVWRAPSQSVDAQHARCRRRSCGEPRAKAKLLLRHPLLIRVARMARPRPTSSGWSLGTSATLSGARRTRYSLIVLLLRPVLADKMLQGAVPYLGEEESSDAHQAEHPQRGRVARSILLARPGPGSRRAADIITSTSQIKPSVRRALRGAEGQQGRPGPQRSTGPPGPRGPEANVERLEGRIRELDADLAHLCISESVKRLQVLRQSGIPSATRRSLYCLCRL